VIDGTDSTGSSERAASGNAYLAILESYLRGDGELALQRAYEMGRFALAQGVGLLELARIHHNCLETLLARATSTQQGETILAGAAHFFAECVSPYEMTYRGFRDANIALRRFNCVLEREAKRIAHSLHVDARDSQGFRPGARTEISGRRRFAALRAANRHRGRARGAPARARRGRAV
jgi:hypothetical protein